MSDTAFVNQETLTDQGWFNDVNAVVYRLLGTSTGPGGAAPTTRSEILSAMGLSTSGGAGIIGATSGSVQANLDALSTGVQSLQSGLTSEAAARASGDATNAAAISAETSRAEAEEATKITNPMTSLGQLVMGGANGSPIAVAAPTASGQVLTAVASGSSGYVWQASGVAAGGTVTSVQVVAGSGLSGGGTVTTSGTINIAISGTGVTSGAYAYPSSITVNELGQVTSVTSGTSGGATGTVTSVSVVGTSGLTGSGTVTTSGTIDVALDTAHANDWTGTQTFNGSASSLAAILNNAAEPAQIIAAAPSATQTLDIASGAVAYFTTAASANWTLNLTFSSGTTLNTAMAVGQAVTCAVLTTQGATAYYNSAVQIDGSAVTPAWQGGTAPTAGNASGIDVYTYTIIKTGSGAFTVLASMTKF